MRIKSQSCILPVAAIYSILALGVVSSSSLAESLAVDDRRLLGTGSPGGQFQLIHYTHPGAPHYVPGVSLLERVKYGVVNSRERVAVFSSRMSAAGVTSGKSGSGDLSSNLSSFVSSLFKIPGLGEYAMEISIGTPPQKLSLLADTGSKLVWAPCSPCSNCSAFYSAALFDTTNSSTYTKMSCRDPFCRAVRNDCNGTCGETCQYTNLYGNPADPLGTIGDLSYETITLNTFGTGTTTTATKFAFGCGSNITTDFHLAPPIAGLDMANVSFTSQLSSLYGNKFSYCMVSLQDSANRTSPLLFGDAAVPTVPTQYTPILHNPVEQVDHYYIGLKGIEVNGVALDIPSGTFDISCNGTGGVISDSGTHVTMLVTAAYYPLFKKVQSLVKYPASNRSGDPLHLCYNLTNVPSPVLPNVTIVFEGFSLDLPQANTFMVIDNDSSTCLAFQESFGHFSIWGNTQQQNFQVLHDREAMQFGYAKVQCDEFS